MNAEDMKNRTKLLALRILKLVDALGDSTSAKVIANQIAKSGTSVAANYRAACRGKSKADFIAKLGIVEEEADETLFWLEMIEESKLLPLSSLQRKLRRCKRLPSFKSTIANRHSQFSKRLP